MGYSIQATNAILPAPYRSHISQSNRVRRGSMFQSDIVSSIEAMRVREPISPPSLTSFLSFIAALTPRTRDGRKRERGAEKKMEVF